MDLVFAIAALLLAAFAASARRTRRSLRLALVAATAVAVPLAIAKQRRESQAATVPGKQMRPHDTSTTAKNGYVSSKACAACHPNAYATWSKTHHAKMTQVPSPTTVQAPWKDGTVLHHQGRTYRLLRRGNAFWVELPRYRVT